MSEPALVAVLIDAPALRLAVQPGWAEILFIILFLLFPLLGRVLNWLAQRAQAPRGAASSRPAAPSADPDAGPAQERQPPEFLRRLLEELQGDVTAGQPAPPREPTPRADPVARGRGVPSATSEPRRASRPRIPDGEVVGAPPPLAARPGRGTHSPSRAGEESAGAMALERASDAFEEQAALGGRPAPFSGRGSEELLGASLAHAEVASEVERLADGTHAHDAEAVRNAFLWFQILGAPVSLREPGAPDAPVGLR